MDSTVDDFLNEIDEIAPLKKSKVDNTTTWQECYDKSSGFKYYWNTKTDEVSWTKPEKYRTAEEAAKDKSSPSCKYLPPTGSPLFPIVGSSSSSSLPIRSENVKIYKIAESPSVISNGSTKNTQNVNATKQLSESKIYSIQSDSRIEVKEGDKISDDEEDDDEDILTKIQKRAKELDTTQKPNKKITKTSKTPTPVGSALNLVAGYSDSEEEFEEEQQDSPKIESTSINFIQENENRVAHSTLFPIPQQIDVKDFIDDNKKEGEINVEKNHSEFDKKAFQRKRRIGVALVNTQPIKKREMSENSQENNDEENQRTGLGFNKETVYSNFSKGGVMFVKADVLNPVTEKLDNQPTDTCKEEKSENVDKKEIEAAYTTLKEKLAFLSEGRPEVSPVQIMIIQAETLFEAMQIGALKFDYLNKWLTATCSDLIKLEKEATPDGWLLQWDRSNKRYYYQNEATGGTQWEYPQLDVTRCDDAMDICTTPPPGGAENIHMSPPLPPVIRSPTPPPPPIISRDNDVDLKKVAENQPLPPGVEAEVKKNVENNPNLETALDSFYSDLAAIENSNSPPPPYPASEVASESLDGLQETKKKKKTKVKLAQGLSMKKKGVSQLVEKWKSVQMNYDN